MEKIIATIIIVHFWFLFLVITVIIPENMEVKIFEFVVNITNSLIDYSDYLFSYICPSMYLFRQKTLKDIGVELKRMNKPRKAQMLLFKRLCKINNYES